MSYLESYFINEQNGHFYYLLCLKLKFAMGSVTTEMLKKEEKKYSGKPKIRHLRRHMMHWNGVFGTGFSGVFVFCCSFFGGMKIQITKTKLMTISIILLYLAYFYLQSSIGCCILLSSIRHRVFPVEKKRNIKTYLQIAALCHTYFTNFHVQFCYCEERYIQELFRWHIWW